MKTITFVQTKLNKTITTDLEKFKQAYAFEIDSIRVRMEQEYFNSIWQTKRPTFKSIIKNWNKYTSVWTDANGQHIPTIKLI